MPRDPDLQSYFSAIRNLGLLTAERERELARRIIRNNDVAARDEMIRSNLRLVVRVARHYCNRNISLQDLIQEGNVGLLKAVEGFNPDMNIRFSTYACWWIKQSMKRALHRSLNPVHIPEYMAEMVARWKKATIDLKAALGDDPSFEEITGFLALSAKAGRVVYLAARDFGPPEQGHINDEDQPAQHEMLADEKTPSPEEIVLNRDQRQAVRTLINQLTTREAEVIRRRFGLDDGNTQTLQQIADNLGLTRERVRQITVEVLDRLHSYVSGRFSVPDRIQNQNRYSEALEYSDQFG